MKRSVTAILLLLLALGAGCGTEAAPCGEGLVEGDDGNCIPGPTSAKCGPGTVLKEGACVAAADASGADGAGGSSSGGADAGVSDGGVGDSATSSSSGGVDAGGSSGGDSGTSGASSGGSTDAGGSSSGGDDDAGSSGGKSVDAWLQGAPDGANCKPACDGKDCGPNGCGGVCGFCLDGKVCGKDGKCAGCKPNCIGKVCGGDGCGGSCGSCASVPGKPGCSGDGKCVAVCVPKCKDNECGPDGCGNLCGQCKAGESCVMDTCQSVTQGLSCKDNCGKSLAGCSCQADCKATDSCCPDFKESCGCIKQCSGKDCGEDGCGGVCGKCAKGKLCSGTDKCVDDPCDPDPCGGNGTCKELAGSCTCKTGYAGAKCDKCAAGYVGFPTCIIDPCSNVDCGAGGTCDPKTGACACKTGFVGPICGTCKFEAETFPNCTCGGATCAACTKGGCDDGNGCTADSCDAAGKCIHASPCDEGALNFALIPQVSGAFNATSATPLTLGFAGTTGVTVKVVRSAQGGPLMPMVAAKSGPSIQFEGSALNAKGKLTMLSVMPKAGQLNAGTLTLVFSKPASAFGAGSRYVLMFGGFGGQGEGPAAVGAAAPMQELGYYDAFDGGKPGFTAADSAVLGNYGGIPSAVQAFAIDAKATTFALQVQQPQEAKSDIFQFAVAVTQLENRCDAVAGKCIKLGATCGDAVVAGGEKCDDGNAVAGDGCDVKCNVEKGYTCSKLSLRSSCGISCTGDSDCANAEVFWNDLAPLAGKTLKLKVDDANSKVELQVPYNADGKSSASNVTVTFHGKGKAGAPKEQTVRTYTPPKSKDGTFKSPANGMTFGWIGSMPYLDLLSSVPWALTMRLDFGEAANALGPEYRYVVGVAGTAGGPGEGPVTVTSNVALTDFGAFDGFGSGKYPALKDAKTIVGTTTKSGYAADGYRFVLLPPSAKSVDLAISSPKVDPHGYLVGIARIRERACLADKCVGTLISDCGNGVLEPLEQCDDGSNKPGDGCDKDCAVEKGWICTPSGKGTTCKKPVCVPSCAGKICGSDGCGGSCGVCNDGNACTVDSCATTGLCAFKAKCAAGSVVWNDLSSLKGSITPTAKAPFAFLLPMPGKPTVKLWRDDNKPIAPFKAPAKGNNGTAKSVAPLNLPLSWKGGFTYININSTGTSLLNGAIHLDFGQTAQAAGNGWRYFVGFTALGWPGNGPMTITSDAAMQQVATFDLWNNAKGASWDPVKRTLTGPKGGPNTPMQFFLVPGGLAKLKLTLAQAKGAGVDTFGLFIGAVNVGETCAGQGTAAKCIAAGSACGDGIKAPGQACDDGNKKAGDGCSATCTIESGYTCSAPVLTSTCTK